MDISIVILNYKSKGDTLNCIKSIKEADWATSSQRPHPSPLLGKEREIQGEGAIRYEIIVVDNNSDDSIGKILTWQYPEIIFIQSSENNGTGSGNNLGIKKAQGDYIVIMNPDTIATKEVFAKLYEYMQANKKVGVVGPLQYNPDGTVQDSCYRWYKLLTPAYRRTPLGKLPFAKKDLDRLLMKDFDHKTEKEVDWLLGSFLFCRASAIKEVGLFDERYFMYFEDTDFCRRFWEKKWRVVYYPEAQIIHNHARQSAQEPWYKFLFVRSTRGHIVSWIKYLGKWGTK